MQKSAHFKAAGSRHTKGYVFGQRSSEKMRHGAFPQLVQKLFELARSMEEADLNALIAVAERLNSK
ncbi:MAG TPA: hypothetical protein DCE08_05295 [Ruminococcaceae bacterium]|nr:hypothetical protein [Oscillospiraceae bacterium]